jgi:hypothetical protein
MEKAPWNCSNKIFISHIMDRFKQLALYYIRLHNPTRFENEQLRNSEDTFVKIYHKLKKEFYDPNN